ncbi:uncharacterized protein METZ01_LOCUS353997, partial [marine metagenome]
VNMEYDPKQIGLLTHKYYSIIFFTIQQISGMVGFNISISLYFRQ